MKTAAYTPGPWRILNDTPMEIFSDTGNVFIADVLDNFCGGPKPAAVAANARLIAAGPEMLAALQRAAEALYVAELYVATASTDQFEREAQAKNTKLVQHVAKEIAAVIAKATT